MLRVVGSLDARWGGRDAAFSNKTQLISAPGHATRSASAGGRREREREALLDLPIMPLNVFSLLFMLCYVDSQLTQVFLDNPLEKAL